MIPHTTGSWVWVLGLGLDRDSSLGRVVVEITSNSMASSLQPDGDDDTPVYRKWNPKATNSHSHGHSHGRVTNCHGGNSDMTNIKSKL